MVLPTVLVLGVLVLYPLVQGIFQSFTDLTESNPQDVICTKTLGGGEDLQGEPEQAEFVGLQNYVDVLTGQRGDFWLRFTNTVVWTRVVRGVPLRARAGPRGHAQPRRSVAAGSTGCC